MTVEFDTLVQAAGREARGRPAPGDLPLLHGDLDRWAAALDECIASVDRQLASRREAQAAAVEAGDADRARQIAGEIADWLPRARRFQGGCAQRRRRLDLDRARETHQRLRAAADRLLGETLDGAVAGSTADAVADLLDRLDEIDPLTAKAS